MTDDGMITLGSASSRRQLHDHPIGELPGRGARCSACRWTEVTIFKAPAVAGAGLTVVSGHVYVVRITGRSILPGEVERRKEEVTDSAHWVVEYLHKRDPEGALYVPLVAKKALALAAARDAGIEDAYVNRAIA